MAKLTVEVPDGWISCITAAGHSPEAIVLEALTQYVEGGMETRVITQTRTWQLCGQFVVAIPKLDAASLQRPEGNPVTNYAEQIDDILYQGR